MSCLPFRPGMPSLPSLPGSPRSPVEGVEGATCILFCVLECACMLGTERRPKL